MFEFSNFQKFSLKVELSIYISNVLALNFEEIGLLMYTYIHGSSLHLTVHNIRTFVRTLTF